MSHQHFRSSNKATVLGKSCEVDVYPNNGGVVLRHKPLTGQDSVLVFLECNVLGLQKSDLKTEEGVILAKERGEVIFNLMLETWNDGLLLGREQGKAEQMETVKKALGL